MVKKSNSQQIWIEAKENTIFLKQQFKWQRTWV